MIELAADTGKTNVSALCQFRRHSGFRARQFFKSEHHCGSPRVRRLYAAGELAIELAGLLKANIESHGFRPGLGEQVDQPGIVAPARWRQLLDLLRTRRDAHQRHVAVQRHFKYHIAQQHRKARGTRVQAEQIKDIGPSQRDHQRGHEHHHEHRCLAHMHKTIKCRRHSDDGTCATYLFDECLDILFESRVGDCVRLKTGERR